MSLVSTLKSFNTFQDANNKAKDSVIQLQNALKKTPDAAKYLKGLSFSDDILEAAGLADSIQNIGTASTGVIGKVKALGTALKGAIVAHPIMAAIAAITTVVGVGVTAWMNYQQSIKEAVENAQVAGDAWSKQNDTLRWGCLE